MKLLITILLFALALTANAGTVPVKVNLPCGTAPLIPCPYVVFYSRAYPSPTAKQLAIYAPHQPIPRDPQHPNYFCSYNSRTQWRIGHPKDGVSGFSATDWQDINIIKAKPTVASNWRWGDCCPSDPNNEVCLE